MYIYAFKQMSELSIRLLTKSFPQKVIGRVFCVVYMEEAEAFMTDLYVEQEFRGNGYGTLLMKCMFEELRPRFIRLVEWSDCSDRYRQPDNLYLRVGAVYKYPDSDPTMCWDLTQLPPVWDSFLEQEEATKCRKVVHWKFVE